jgi:putative ATP-dependent endonuclease of OLD family
MRVVKLEIENFRGIAKASLEFDSHTLLLGANNVGKSTIFEALELVLGPERLAKYPPIDEYDFHNAAYLKVEDNKPLPVPLRVEVTLIELSEEVANTCAPYTAYWNSETKKVLGKGEVEAVDLPKVVECLRLTTIGQYDPEQDEFSAKTYYLDGAIGLGMPLAEVSRKSKQMFGFLYLRALRTGSRALTLERNSLLDVILRRRKVVMGLWQSAIDRLKGLDPPIDEGASHLRPILDNIEKRIAQYIPLTADGPATKLFVSQLTREHLRKTISFFLSTSTGQEPVPFHEVGTGTLNALMLAMLSFIADIKKDNVIFAMEEPEIALSPHTQRRIANYLLGSSNQCFVSSHSPYIIERFEPSSIRILRKDNASVMSAITVPVGSTLKGKMYRRHARRGLAEAMLGRGAIVAEGISERDALLAAAERMEEAEPDTCYPLDLSGVTVISVDGEGSIPEFGAFFKALGLHTSAFYDNKAQTPDEIAKFAANFDINCQTAYKGIEKLLSEETPVSVQWAFLSELAAEGAHPVLPNPKPNDDGIKKLLFDALCKEKGNGYCGRLLIACPAASLPKAIRDFLSGIYAAHPVPTKVPLVDEEDKAAAAPAADGEGTDGQ